MKEIKNNYYKMWDEYITLVRLIPERIKELSDSAKQKGINDFGWEPIAINEADVHLATFEALIANEFVPYRFKFNNDGELVITEYYDYRTCKYVKDQEIPFSYTAWYNIPSMINIITLIEEELGVES